MQINEGDLIILERSVSMTYNHQPIYALVVKKDFTYGRSKRENASTYSGASLANHCECILLVNGLERRAHVFAPKGKNWSKNKIIAHIFAPSRKEQKEKGINIGNVWGDFDIKQIIKAKEEQ